MDAKDSVTKELKEHLIHCEEAMHTSTQIVNKHNFPTDNRTRTVIGFISVLVQHQESIMLLVIHGNPHSASALVRPVVEGAFRALWINRPATDAEVMKFNEKDKIDLTFGEIGKAVDTAYGGQGMFESFKNLAWNGLNSLTHGGMHQIGRCFVEQEGANSYSEEDLLEITTLVTVIVLLAIVLFLEKHGHSSSVNQIQSLVRSFDRPPTS